MVRSKRAHVARAQGDYPLAARLYGEALADAQSLGNARQTMYQVAGLAGVALATGQPQRAARLLGAVAAAQEAMGFGSILRDLNTRQAPELARAQLGDDAFAAAWESGRAMPWPDAVADALAVLEPEAAHLPAPRPVPGPRKDAFDLTRREREILGLLAQRLTDPEIAAALFISPRTASKHVGGILIKLDVTTRGEAAVHAVRHALI